MPILLFLMLIIGAPLLELYVLIRVGSQIGALPTIALSILTAMIGIWLVRRQGFSLLLRVHEQADRGEIPALEMMNGALIIIAGLLLLVPGFLSDTLGLLLLVPPIREAMIGRYVRVIPIHHPHDGRHQERGPRVIEGDYRRED